MRALRLPGLLLLAACLATPQWTPTAGPVEHRIAEAVRRLSSAAPGTAPQAEMRLAELLRENSSVALAVYRGLPGTAERAALLRVMSRDGP